MQPLTFACSSCGKRVGVPAEFAGRKVRCPHCKAVVTAPSAAGVAAPVVPAPPKPTPPAPRPPEPASHPTPAPVPSEFTFSAPQQEEGAESIFGEAEEANDSLFAAPKPKLRPPPAPAPPEQAAPPSAPPVVAPADVPASVAPDDNPFADMADASLATTVTSPGESPVLPEVPGERPAVRKPSAAKRSVSWQLVVIVLLAGYSFVVTMLAAWGWLRTPAGPADPTPVKAAKS